MANEKISALADGVAPAASDEFVVARSGANYKLSWDQLGPIVGSGVKAANYWPTPSSSLGTVAPTLSELRAHPFPLAKQTTFDRIALDHQSTPTATSVGRLGIYSDNGRGEPGALILDAGTVDLSTAAALKSIVISQTLDPGVYWLACCVQVAFGPYLRNFTSNPYKTIMQTTAPTNYSFSVVETLTRAAVAGAFPDPFAATATAGVNSSIAVYLRAA